MDLKTKTKNATNFGTGVPQARRDGLVGQWKPADPQPKTSSEQLPHKVEAIRERYFVNDIIPFEDARLNIGSATRQFVRIYLINAPVVSSDERTKENIKDTAYGLKDILKLAPKTYKQIQGKGDKKNKNTESIGLLAQDVEKVIPEAVFHDERADVYGIQYDHLVPVLIKAVQELADEVKKLKGGGK